MPPIGGAPEILAPRGARYRRRRLVPHVRHARHGPRGRHQGLDPRHDRRDAAGAAQPHRRRAQVPARREAGAVQPGRIDQGPRRAAADRGGRARRQPAAGRHDHRADVGQHRHRPGDRRAAEGLSRDRGHAGQDVAREDRPAARVRGRGGHRADRRRARVAAVLLPRRRPPHRGDPGRVPAQPVPQPREPADALRDDRAGAVAPDRRASSPTSSRASAPAGRSPAWRATCASRTRTSSWSAPIPVGSIYSGDEVHPVPRRGRGRGLLAGRRTTRRWSTATCASPTATRSSRRAGSRRPRACCSAAPAGSRCTRRSRSRASIEDPEALVGGGPARRRPRVPLEDLQRHVDGLARHARAHRATAASATCCTPSRPPGEIPPLVVVETQQKVKDAIALLHEHRVSQLPVVSHSDPTHGRRLDRRARAAQARRRQPGDHGHADRRRDGAAVPGGRRRSTRCARPSSCCRGDRQALLVTEHGRPTGIVTRADLLEALVS